MLRHTKLHNGFIRACHSEDKTKAIAWFYITYYTDSTYYMPDTVVSAELAFKEEGRINS